jgi:hypothetical protein
MPRSNSACTRSVSGRAMDSSVGLKRVNNGLSERVSENLNRALEKFELLEHDVYTHLSDNNEPEDHAENRELKEAVACLRAAKEEMPKGTSQREAIKGVIARAERIEFKSDVRAVIGGIRSLLGSD